jgi:hypothetical protein
MLGRHFSARRHNTSTRSHIASPIEPCFFLLYALRPCKLAVCVTAGFLTAELLKIQVFKRITLCRWIKSFRRFEGSQRLHHHGPAVRAKLMMKAQFRFVSTASKHNSEVQLLLTLNFNLLLSFLRWENRLAR